MWPIISSFNFVLQSIRPSFLFLTLPRDTATARESGPFRYRLDGSSFTTCPSLASQLFSCWVKHVSHCSTRCDVFRQRSMWVTVLPLVSHNKHGRVIYGTLHMLPCWTSSNTATLVIPSTQEENANYYYFTIIDWVKKKKTWLTADD